MNCNHRPDDKPLSYNTTLPDPPIQNCLHCRHYTIEKRFCVKNYFRNPYRKPLTPACQLWQMSKDAIFAWRNVGPSNNPTENWAREKLRQRFREAAYGNKEDER